MPTNIGNRLEIQTDAIACIKEADAQRLERYLVKENDIVYSRRGDVEKCAFITNKQSGWLCGTGCLRVRFTSEDVDPRFCAFYLSTDEIKGWVSGNAVGTTMPNLNTSILARLPLNLPPIPEQKAIASVLSSLDDKIDLLHRQNKTLEAMAETLFRQWFIEAEPQPSPQPSPSGRGSKKEAQEGWEEKRLADYADHIKAGMTPAKNSMQIYTHYSLPAFDEGRRCDRSEIRGGAWSCFGQLQFIEHLETALRPTRVRIERTHRNPCLTDMNFAHASECTSIK